jgi:hypothetical protein
VDEDIRMNGRQRMECLGWILEVDAETRCKRELAAAKAHASRTSRSSAVESGGGVAVLVWIFTILCLVSLVLVLHYFNCLDCEFAS